MKKKKTQIIVLAAALLLCLGTYLAAKAATDPAINSVTNSAADPAADTAISYTVSDASSVNTGASAVNAAASSVSVYFFQAGKADAELITTENYTVLIDCGVKGFGQTILDYLSEQGIDHIDYLIITHFDQDHVGGAAKVINNIPVYNILQNNCPKDSSEYEKYIKAVTNAGIEPLTVAETCTFELDGVVFTVDPPQSLHYADDESNNSSLIVTMVNGDITFLFMGDAQTERLEEYLESGAVDCDVLKVPHHGQEEILIEDLITAVNPEYAVITSSDEEPESESVLSVLENSGAEIYLTRQSGVLMTSDVNSIHVQ